VDDSLLTHLAFEGQRLGERGDALHEEPRTVFTLDRRGGELAVEDAF
jgi:hypothetical protein